MKKNFNEPLKFEDVYQVCDSKYLNFKTIESIKIEQDFIGQERAKSALDLSLNVNHRSYHLFAMGPSGIGKRSFLVNELKKHAKTGNEPKDYCYVFNFESPHNPMVLEFKKGSAKVFKQDMQDLTKLLWGLLTALFQGPDFRAQINLIVEEFTQQENNMFSKISDEAKKHDLTLMKTEKGIAILPFINGKVVAGDDFDKLPKEQQEKFLKDIKNIQTKLSSVLLKIPTIEQNKRDKVIEFSRSITKEIVSSPMKPLKLKWKNNKNITKYLRYFEDFISENYKMFIQDNSDEKSNETLLESAIFEVNLFVDDDIRENTTVAKPLNSGDSAPLIFLEHPTYNSLFGKIEYLSKSGGLFTNFTLLKPGALHLANSGYLILEARKLLEQPWVWDRLKYTLKTMHLQMENRESMYSMSQNIITIEPQAIPLSVKVMMIGEPEIYMALIKYDPEFQELFGVVADFDTSVAYGKEGIDTYLLVLSSLTKNENLIPLTNKAFGRVVEHGIRLAEDKTKLTTHFGQIIRIVREANYIAEHKDLKLITENEVTQAVDNLVMRSNRIYTAMQKQVYENVLKIQTSGKVVGQINALAVVSIFDSVFGSTHRISCNVYQGQKDIIDIEHSVDLGGAFHTKGVLILSSFLHYRFSQEIHLTFSSTITFEQSYSKIDGDSASSTELYALLSALSDVPIMQNFAVTGSVDQRGYVQAIGGVNNKIEGFFDICKKRGLDGTHGVLIPKSNVKNLQLKYEVAEAIKNKKFKIYAVEHIDEGIEILTGIPAGEPNSKGEYPKDSINGRIVARYLKPKKKSKK